LRFGCAFCVCVSLSNVFSVSFSVSKSHSVARDGKMHTQNAHKKRKCNRPLSQQTLENRNTKKPPNETPNNKKKINVIH
jgi:hypothetical protein